ncbi:MAG TPA: polysaccharide deacetylase family protein [Xanthobacteraceae bacterium]|nr:polysaccharide deacetylase family protein [Xanthobacteraceae bacterium]
MFVRTDRDREGGSLSAKWTGKATRFLARHIPSKALSLRHGPAMVTFTFDDVPASACEIGAGILETYNARGTFYVAGRGCGTAGDGGPPLASIEQLRAIWAKGHEIGCHTYSHPAVSRISVGLLGAELERNRWALKNIDSEIELRNFAYPYGDLSWRSKRFLQSRFDSCRSVHRGINRGFADLGSLKAWPLESATIDRAKVATLIAAAIAKNGWLIFYSHEVAARPNRFGVTPDLLAFAVATARQSGCVVCTIGGAIEIARRRSPVLGATAPLSLPSAQGGRSDEHDWMN